MKRKLGGLILGLVCCVGASGPAKAGDFNYGAGSLKDYGAAAVPVPAPVPVPVYAPEWYFRVDIGVGFGSDPSVSTSGEPFGIPFAAEPVGYDPSLIDKSFDTTVTGGVGVGYIWSRYFRTDITFDYRSEAEANISGSQIYVDSVGNYGQADVDDQNALRTGVFLLNGYFDFGSHFGFTPYVGGGVGFAYNELKRNSETTDSDCGADPTCAAPALVSSSGGSETEHDISFAAAATAGVSYAFNPTVVLDVNYRYLYIGGSDVNLNINGVSTLVEIGDINEHQVRAGLRFNVD